MRYDSETWKRRPDVFKFEPIFILVICRRKHPWIVSLHSDSLLMEFWSLYLGCYQPNSVFSIFNVLLKIAWYCPFKIQVSWSVSWSVFELIERVLIGMFIGYQHTCTWPNWCNLIGSLAHELLMSLRSNNTWFDTQLKVDCHITKTCKAAFFFIFFNIRRIRKFLSYETVCANFD